MVNTVKNFLMMPNNLQQMRLKLLQKEQFKKLQKQLVIWLLMKLLKKSRKFQKIHNEIIQKHLEMSMIKKYLKKDVYLQKKDKKLLMSWDKNKIKVLRNSQKYIWETVTNENDKEMPK